MTIGTTIMFYRIGEIYLVTGLAVHILVFPLQFEICFVMIEFFNSLHHLKGFLIMTLTTVLAKLVRMGVFMTIVAAVVLNVTEMLKFFSVDRLNPMTF
jgi:hypothetical protein